ncbi:phage integrase SAM-like domain and Arm DNA-binding domain-containing protein, partial [Bacteroides heparinolyticus]|uniref:phage integrase SAM-like domain and Arm DNA-binding domain-containing protein n=1 Tax=Prevotella heparinolytica TaxID=28113 RepID=UPI0035A08D30
MKSEKFKVLLYLKKSSPDKSGKTPIMGRITVGQSVAQFSCKLSCTPSLWNPRESRLNGKSREAVVTNGKLDKLLLSINEAYNSLTERNQPFDAEAVKNLFQGSMDVQMTILRLFDRHIEEVKARIGIDVSHRTLPNYLYTRKRLAAFIKKSSNSSDLAFSQLNEQFIREFQDFIILEEGLGVETARKYLALLKKICRIAFK